MIRWHERESALPACGQKTERGLLCVRPGRWTLMKDEHYAQVCTAHASKLVREGWVRVPAIFNCIME